MVSPVLFTSVAKGPVADDSFRAVGQLQSLTRPAVAAPVKTLECVSTPFDSHVPGVLSPLLRPAASSLTARP